MMPFGYNSRSGCECNKRKEKKRKKKQKKYIQTTVEGIKNFLMYLFTRFILSY